MIITVEINNKQRKFNLNQPIDISIPISGKENDANAWYVDPAKISPVEAENFIGSVKQGASVNFRNIIFNPHGNGTHTECVGHIAEEVYSINQTLKQFFFLAQVVTVSPINLEEDEGEHRKKGDKIIYRHQLEKAVTGNPEAVVIRTLPNDKKKQHKQYSNTNWPYLDEDAALFLRELGVKHLLIDLPSVDREFDGGKLLAHRAFWNYPENPRMGATITEFIFVSDEVKDGEYLLNLQIAPFENDASPSKPVLYQVIS